MNGINKVTCKFENPEIEANFLDYNWRVQSRSVKISLYFSIAFIIANLAPEIIGRTSNSIIVSFIVPLVFSIILLKSSDDFKRKYFEKFFSIFLSLSIPFVQYLNIDIYRQDYDLPAFPYIIPIIILKILPISFSWALPAALITFITTTLILDHSLMEPQMYLISLLIFTFFVYDKWNVEISKRNDYSQNVTIEDTRLLMYETLKRYFGETLSDQILSEKGKLSGQIKWVSIAFTDISSYSTIIENMSPKVAVKLLNQYFSKMHDIIEKHNGHILNYIGDSIMIVFGAPNDIEDHELKAVECAIEMRKSLDN